MFFFQITYVNSNLKNYSVNIISIFLLITFPEGLPNIVSSSKMTLMQMKFYFSGFYFRIKEVKFSIHVQESLHNYDKLHTAT